VLRTDPAGAEIRRGMDFLGRSGEVIRFRLDDESRSLKLLFELDGFRPVERTILTNDLVYREVYPPHDQTPIVLLPRSAFGMIWLWLRRHPAFTVGLLSLCLIGWLTWIARNRERLLLKRWTGRLEALLEGSRSLNSHTAQDAIWQELLGLAERLLPGESIVVTPTCSLLGEKAGRLTVRTVKTLLEATRDTDGVLHIDDFAASPYDRPTPESQSALVALCRDGCNEGAILVLADKRGVFQPEHSDLAALLANQASSALVHHSVNERLAKQEKRAAIGNMAAGLAHELNNPLGALQLALDSAMDSLDYSPKSAKSMLGKASGAIARARALNENFLRFTGETQASPLAPLEFEELVSQTLEALEHSLADTELNSTLNSCTVLGNEHDLEMVITNLLLNAKDAVSEADPKQIKLELETSDQKVVLRIEDFGTGIPSDVKNRIFEPFFTTKPLGSGWGLGLSVCREIVEQHSGTLEIQPSSNGEGTLAVVTLPKLEAES
jgi:C4-dicarboxylate-specific signal transduction histidine kinase